MLLAIKILLTVSVFLFCDAIIRFVWMLIRPFYTRHKKDFYGIKNPTKNIMHIALLVLFAVWCLRLSVGFFELNNSVDRIHFGSLLYQTSNSLLHTLMSFSMDEEFAEYLLAGSEMIGSVFSDFPWMKNYFNEYSALLNVAAPIAGGAIILDIIAELSPQFHFIIAKCCFWREKYYFTALNEQSLSLAKDIVTSKNHHRSTIVFTDVYADDENEESSEQLLRAKSLGAICLKDDLLHISINRFRLKTVRIFLSDRNENDNLDALARILCWKNRRLFKNLEIYVFSSDRMRNNNKVSFLEDEVTYISNRMLTKMEEKDANKKEKFITKYESKINKFELEKKERKKNKVMNRYAKQEERKFPVPRITPVNGVRNMAQKLFYKLPLFEGLYGKEDENKILRLTIFGSGVIGTELFLNAYWIGQMLNVLLEVTIVSKEKENEFRSKIDYLNPEILKTTKNDKILDFKTGSETERRCYLKLNYLSRNLMSSDFMEKVLSGTDETRLIESDYFIVALGSDQDNFTIADKLRQAVGYYHLNYDAAKERKTIISYVIYNSALCRNLNHKCRHDNVVSAKSQADFDVYMHAFGSMDDVYSMENIMFDDVRLDAEQIGVDYRKKSAYDRLETWKTISANYYNYRSDIARRLHLYYKAYSAGYIKPTLFRTTDDEEYKNGLLSGSKAFRDFIQSVEKGKEDITLLHQLAWLEHRRWNAFMRICGFRHPDDFDRYRMLDNDIHNFNDHKFLMLKLHPCLVESDMTGIHAKLTFEGHVDEESLINFDCELDKLDELTYRNIQLKGLSPIAKNDFKRWDYPECEKF